MANDEKNQGNQAQKKADYEARRQERKDRKIALASREDTAVRVSRTVESRLLLEMQPSADLSLSILRSKIGIDPRYTLEKAGVFTQRFMQLLVDMDILVADMSALTGVRYRQPGLLKARAKGEPKAEDKSSEKAEEKPAGEAEDKPAEVVALDEGATLQKARKKAATA